MFSQENYWNSKNDKRKGKEKSCSFFFTFFVLHTLPLYVPVVFLSKNDQVITYVGVGRTLYFQPIVQSSLFSKTLSTGKKGKRVCYVFHANIRIQELWNTHQASHLENLDKNHKANLYGESQNESQFFLLSLPISVAGPGLQISGFLNVFPAKNCFHVCILIANFGSLLTMPFLHCVQELFFIWKSSEFPVNGNQTPSLQ